MATNKSGVNGDSLEVQSATVKDLLDAGAIETGELDREGPLIFDSSAWELHPLVITQDIDDVSTSTFTTVADMRGTFDQTLQPDGTTLYAQFGVEIISVPTGETGTYRPNVIVLRSGRGANATDTSELEIEVTEANNGEFVTTGWVEITDSSTIASDVTAIKAQDIEAKVTSGTMETFNDRASFAYAWRVD